MSDFINREHEIAELNQVAAGPDSQFVTPSPTTFIATLGSEAQVVTKLDLFDLTNFIARPEDVILHITLTGDSLEKCDPPVFVNLRQGGGRNAAFS